MNTQTQTQTPDIDSLIQQVISEFGSLSEGWIRFARDCLMKGMSPKEVIKLIQEQMDNDNDNDVSYPAPR